MKRLPIILSLPALMLVAACSDDRGDGAANSNENIATDDGTMMAPTEMPTTNGNGVPATDGTMGTDPTGTAPGSMSGTAPGSASGTAPGSTTRGTTTGGTTGTTGTGMDTPGTTGTTGGTRTDRPTPPE